VSEAVSNQQSAGSDAAGKGVTLTSLRDLAMLRDFVPARAETPAVPDTALPRAVFPWLAARIAARRRDNLPVSDASLRADLSLGFAAQAGEAFVWPEVSYEGETGARLHLLARPPEKPPIAVACQYPRRSSPGQLPATARQLGDVLRDSLRLAKAFGARGLPLQVLLCTDEFRTYLAGLHPPLRILRPDAAGTTVEADLSIPDLEEGTHTRLAEALTAGGTTLHLALDVLGYAPVGPLHLGMWRVVAAAVR
jgi:hypothetical protein